MCVVCVAFILKQNIWEAVTQLWVETLLQYFITAARSGIKSWKFSLSLFLQSSRPQMSPMISVCVRQQTLKLYIEWHFSCFSHLLHPTLNCYAEYKEWYPKKRCMLSYKSVSPADQCKCSPAELTNAKFRQYPGYDELNRLKMRYVSQAFSSQNDQIYFRS